MNELTGPIADFDLVMGQVKDGVLFERFAQDLLCQIIGKEFTPLGGVHDGGRDGIEFCHREKGGKKVYQFSIEKDPDSKIRKTITALRKRTADFSKLYYITNQQVGDQDAIEERIEDDLGVRVKIRDRSWLRGQISGSVGPQRTYLAFLQAHFHSFRAAGASGIVIDFETDPRLYVFLRQQFEVGQEDKRLDEALTDSLIIYALEGTDPDLKKFMKRDEVLARINAVTGFAPRTISDLLDRRLAQLTSKPRRVNFHPQEDAYCLPYETRIEIEEKNISDAALRTSFLTKALERLQKALKVQGLKVTAPDALLEKVINRIFKRQGLEFSQFLQKSENADAVEKSLDEVISEVVDESAVVAKNRSAAKRALLAAVRDIIYKGSPEELEFLRRLASTYVLLFLLQCDPKLATFFSVMAGGLCVFVDNSILVPVLSEFPLEMRHRRHWNLLIGARKSGVRLLVERATLSELVSHVRKVVSTWDNEYARVFEIYKEEGAVLYVKEILIRSYLYSCIQGKTWTFRQFIDSFVSPSGTRMEEELKVWLNTTFGIEVIDDDKLVDPSDWRTLADKLGHTKDSMHQAENDARAILAVYGLRKRNSESCDNGIFGFKTWWLSKDTLTHRAVESCFGRKYQPSCYMRPDFLYNYITLAPSVRESGQVFDSMFPSLLGVNVSHHLPDDVRQTVHDKIAEHGQRDPGRIRAVVRNLTEQLMTEKVRTRAEVRHFLDDECARLGSSDQ